MDNYTVEQLAGAASAGCQGYAEANAALLELVRRAKSAEHLLAFARNVAAWASDDGEFRGRGPMELAEAARAAIAKAAANG